MDSMFVTWARASIDPPRPTLARVVDATMGDKPGSPKPPGHRPGLT